MPDLWLFFFICSVNHRDLHSFPTRRSSDLTLATQASGADGRVYGGDRRTRDCGNCVVADRRGNGEGDSRTTNRQGKSRSEEHTSELQSLTNLVCRLLLEKKKKKTKQQNNDL